MRKSVFFVFLILLAILPVKALAQTATVSSSVKQATASASLAMDILPAVNLFMSRVKAAVFRADKIAQRISRRSGASSKLISGQKSLTGKLDQAKIDLSQLDMQSQVLTASGSSPQNYLLFKSQAATFVKNLKDIYKAELDLISEMKKTATVAATPGITVTPAEK